MREVRAEDHAFELAVMADIDGKFCESGHFLPRLDTRRGELVAVKAARARLGHGAEDAVIGAAAAQMPRKRRADLLARGCPRCSGCPPAVVKRRRLDDEARRAESALQGIVRHESL